MDDTSRLEIARPGASSRSFGGRRVTRRAFELRARRAARWEYGYLDPLPAWARIRRKAKGVGDGEIAGERIPTISIGVHRGGDPWDPLEYQIYAQRRLRGDARCTSS